MQNFEVRAEYRSDPLRSAVSGAFISATDLGVPSGAVKEFGKANQLIGQRQWTKAIDKLQKAIAIYPNYSSAYNNLGVAYTHVGDPLHGEEALRKAISINDHLVPAYVNLARVQMGAKDMPAAEVLLNKACSLAPPDATSLVLLSYVQLMNQHLDEAILTAKRAHSDTPGEHAFVHITAARAFRAKNQGADAIAELQQFLNEEPSGPRAQQARKALAWLQSQH